VTHKVVDWTHFCSIQCMSSAFIREQDEQWLHEVPPTLPALIYYLTKENNGIRVYEQRVTTDQNRTVHHLSNGLQYYLDDKGQWTIQW
jgi:hypothetical protein